MNQIAPDTISLPGRLETSPNLEDSFPISNKDTAWRRSPSVRVSVQCTEIHSSVLSIPTEMNRSDCNDIENQENLPLLENEDTLKRTTPHNKSEEQNLKKRTDKTPKDHASVNIHETDSERPLINTQSESTPEKPREGGASVNIPETDSEKPLINTQTESRPEQPREGGASVNIPETDSEKPLINTQSESRPEQPREDGAPVNITETDSEKPFIKPQTESRPEQPREGGAPVNITETDSEKPFINTQTESTPEKPREGGASVYIPETDSERPFINTQSESTPEQPREGGASVNIHQNQDSQKRTNKLCSKQRILYVIIILIVVVQIGAIIGLYVSNKNPSKQYLMCELNRDKLSTQDGPVTLPWNIQRDQKYGNIEVIKDTVIVVPEDGVYDIHVTLNEEIPKDMPQLAIMTFTFEGDKGIIKVSKRPIEVSGIDKPMTMNFSLRRLLQANEKIWFKRNLAKYNRIKQPSGTLTITKII